MLVPGLYVGLGLVAWPDITVAAVTDSNGIGQGGQRDEVLAAAVVAHHGSKPWEVGPAH